MTHGERPFIGLCVSVNGTANKAHHGQVQQVAAIVCLDAILVFIQTLTKLCPSSFDLRFLSRIRSKPQIICCVELISNF